MKILGLDVKLPAWTLIGFVVAVIAVGVGIIGAMQLQKRLAMSRRQLVQLQAENERWPKQEQIWNEERQGLEERMQLLRNELNTTTTQLDSIRQELSKARSNLKERERRQGTLVFERDELKADYKQAKREVERLENMNSTLTRTAETLRYQLAQLERQYAQQVALNNTQKELDESRIMPEGQVVEGDIELVEPTEPTESIEPVELIEAAQSAQATIAQFIPTDTDSASLVEPMVFSPGEVISLPPIVVHDGANGSNSAIRGRVVAVDMARRFIIINRGKANGVQKGDKFEIRHSGRQIGTVVAMQLRTRLSACDILSLESATTIMVGDLLIQKHKNISDNRL